MREYLGYYRREEEEEHAFVPRVFLVARVNFSQLYISFAANAWMTKNVEGYIARFLIVARHNKRQMTKGRHG